MNDLWIRDGIEYYDNNIMIMLHACIQMIILTNFICYHQYANWQFNYATVAVLMDISTVTDSHLFCPQYTSIIFYWFWSRENHEVDTHEEFDMNNVN